MKDYILSLAIIALSACSSYDLGSSSPISVDVNTESPTWENGIQELVSKKCDNCHSKVSSRFVPGEIRDDTARYSIGFSESEAGFLNYASLSYKRVFNDAEKPMPPKYGTPLDENEHLALKKYLEAQLASGPSGAGDDSAQVKEACAGIAPNSLSFVSEVQPVEKLQCGGCHASATGVGGLDLSTAAQWKKEKVNILVALSSKTSTNKMPPGRADSYAAEGGTGRVFLNYLCGSAEANSN